MIDGGRRTAGPQNERASMAEVEIYTTPFCPYCWRAKSLLEKKGVAFAEIDLWQHPERRAEMALRAGGRTTVPQVFVDGRALGGADELIALESRGELDAALSFR
jgi:glutaredoxin 3